MPDKILPAGDNAWNAADDAPNGNFMVNQ